MVHQQVPLLHPRGVPGAGDGERQGDLADVGALEAVRLEDGLLYDEPPTWELPVRPYLGAALLAANRPADAERVYKEDLAKFRENGWSLFGLAAALDAQGKSAEAAEVRTRLTAAWAGADVALTASRF